jgi:hypothetical protein
MSRALRGDFERLRERGVSTTLAPRAPAVGPPAPEDVPEREPAPGVEELPVAEPAAAESPELEPAVEPEEHDVTMSRPGLFARLIGR